MSAKAVGNPGDYKLLLEVVKGRIASAVPSLSDLVEDRMWLLLDQNIAHKASSICEGIVQTAHSQGANLNSDWFCDRRKEIFNESASNNWDSVANEVLLSAKAVPLAQNKLAHPPAMEQATHVEAQAVAQPRGEEMDEEEDKDVNMSSKRSREDFEVDDAFESSAKAQVTTPVKDEDDAMQSAGGRMRAEEHRRRQINSEMLNALRSELPERDRAAFTGGNNSTVNTLSHAIDFIHKLKEKKARCMQELALLDGADMGVFSAENTPAIVHPLQQMSQQVHHTSQMNLSRMMPMGGPQMGLEAFMGLAGVKQQPQQQQQQQQSPANPANNHRVSQYLKIAQVTGLTLECLAFSNPNAWLPIGSTSVGSGVLSVHENNSLCGRIVGELAVPFATVLQRLQEGDWHQHIPDWSPCTVHASSTVEVVGPGTGVYKTTLLAPSNPNAVLEVCQIRHVMASSTVQGRLILSFTSTSHDSPPLNGAAETAQINPSGCILEATPDGQGCKVVVVMDLGPGWGAAEGLVQQLLRSNFQATAQMALVAAPSPAAPNPNATFAQPQVPMMGMIGQGLSAQQQPQQPPQQQHPYHTEQHMHDKVMRANSFPSLSLASGVGFATRAPSGQEDMAWNHAMPGPMDLRQDSIMHMLKRAGKQHDDARAQHDAVKRPQQVISAVGSMLR